ncbi:MAG: type II toxin-antitoxin system VapB family antitoxin [Deltaproteobacteria bacterium]|nr:type II toxin-antitoxin system VapB family antitoxin [Deltaproteobacteria bacterium]
MPTNLNIDDRLLREALRLSGKRSKREAVNEALAEYVQKRRQRGVLKLFGSLEWDGGFDYKVERDRGGK